VKEKEVTSKEISTTNQEQIKMEIITTNQKQVKER
jgi:hypothetical protein